jgi:hypothetical protein
MKEKLSDAKASRGSRKDKRGEMDKENISS